MSAGMSRAQCRAARALVGWSMEAAARCAGLSLSTIADFESGRRMPHARNLAALRAALESAGVQFIDDGEASPSGGSGVRIDKGAGDKP